MTSFQKVYDAFFQKMEEDRDFFQYFDLTEAQAMALARDRAHTYMMESIAIIDLKIEPDSGADFYDFEEDIEAFNWDLSRVEINLLASFMYEQEYRRQYSKLKAFELQHVPTTLQMFSPSNERKTIKSVLDGIHDENMSMLDNYCAKDRSSRKFKEIDYASYADSDS